MYEATATQARWALWKEVHEQTGKYVVHSVV
jgi:hypothetical protein